MVKQDIYSYTNYSILGNIMRILVTGVTGFIGYSLAQELVKKGFDVWGLVRFSSTGKSIPHGVKPIVGDLTDYHSIVKVIQTVRPNIVVHLGAITPVSESFEQPILYAETNYLGTIHILEAIRKYNFENLELFLFAGTTEVFGNQNVPYFDENTPFKPNSPYAVSKVAAIHYVEYMYETYQLPTVVIIPCNSYGRALVKQRHFVIEKIITSMLEGKKIIELGDPNVIRDFMFRDDHVSAYLTVIDKGLKDKELVVGQRFCFGTGKGYTIKEVFEICKNIIGWDGEVRWYVFIRPNDIRRIVVNYDKAKKILGWIPKYDIVSGLRKATEEWKKVLGK